MIAETNNVQRQLFANLPSASANTGARIFVADAGMYGHWFVSDGTSWHPVGPLVLYTKGTAETALTGTTDETVIRPIPVPAGIMRLSGSIYYSITWSMTNGADDKTLRVRLGGLLGTAFTARVVTTSAGGQLEGYIHNRGAANSQVGQPAGISGVSESTGAVITGSVDTSAATTLDITGQLENAANSITVQRVMVLIY